MKGGPGGHGPGGPGGGPASQAVATYLGITVSALQSDLKGGQTLAQVATAQGKTVAGLEAAILADAKSHLDAAVTAGKLTSAQETTMLADLSSHVADIVNSTGPPAGGPRRPALAELTAAEPGTGGAPLGAPPVVAHVRIGTDLPAADLWATFGVGDVDDRVAGRC